MVLRLVGTGSKACDFTALDSKSTLDLVSLVELRLNKGIVVPPCVVKLGVVTEASSRCYRLLTAEHRVHLFRSAVSGAVSLCITYGKMAVGVERIDSAVGKLVAMIHVPLAEAVVTDESIVLRHSVESHMGILDVGE